MTSPEAPNTNMVREFCAADPGHKTSRGVLTIRAAHYGSSLGIFDRLYDQLTADASHFDPPAEISREKAQVRHYAGETFSGTFGLEVALPEGHVVSAEYTRVPCTELLK